MSRAVLMLLAVLLAGCAAARREEGPELARAAGWRWEILSAGVFDLATASAPREDCTSLPAGGESGMCSGTGILVIYLEGDGLAYVHAQQPAVDPTPTDPTALRLALAASRGDAVVWLGRPCQYTLPEHGRNCRTAYWTTGRYAPEVIDSMGMAVDALKKTAGAGRVMLVGYSGGGAIAALLAARRTDVAEVVTVAADLDLDYWTSREGLTPLGGSLDPALAAARLGATPQIHFTGGRDHRVGTDVVQSFMRRLPPGTPAQLVEIPGFDHDCCWVRDWPALIETAWPPKRM